MITREQFIDDVDNCLTETDVATMFGVTKQELENDMWNQNLEIAYNEYATEIEYAEEQEQEYEPHNEMSCDLTGYCSGTGCPNYWKCH